VLCPDSTTRLGSQPRGSLVRVRRALEVAGALVGDREVELRVGARRVERERRFELLDRARRVVQVVERRREVVSRHDAARVELARQHQHQRRPTPIACERDAATIWAAPMGATTERPARREAAV
jgi:hypothetical protein